jgi:hypothetical protein
LLYGHWENGDSMTPLLFLALTAFLGLHSPSQDASPWIKQRATVTLTYFDSFGHSAGDCEVKEFTSFNEGDATDYGRYFTAMVGKNIPFGKSYRVTLSCDQRGMFGPLWASVEKPDQLIILSSFWAHGDGSRGGDYNTGFDPRLTISVTPIKDTHLSGRLWMKLMGVYMNQTELAHVDPKSGSAQFFMVFPGRFVLLVLDDNKLVCTKQMDLLSGDATLKISISSSGCRIDQQLAIREVD